MKSSKNNAGISNLFPTLVTMVKVKPSEVKAYKLNDTQLNFFFFLKKKQGE